MLARALTRLVGTISTLLLMQALGFFGLTAILWATGQFESAVQVGWHGWAWAFGAALLSAAGSLTLYRAFEIGVISVVSPIAATYAAVAVGLALLTGTRLNVQHGAGIGLALLGVLLAATGTSSVVAGVDTPLGISRPHLVTPRGARQGVFLAVLTSVFFGIAFWLFGWQVTPALGGIVPVWVVRLVTTSLVGGIVLTSGKRREPLPAHPPLWFWFALVGIAVLDTAAYAANVWGLTTGDVAVVNVLSSLFSAVTVVLAWIFLREKLLARQWLGIGVILVGVALVSL